MAERSADWISQARHNLQQAQVSLSNGLYDWSCFAAQQAAEMAVKAVFHRKHEEALGHSITKLLERLGVQDVELLNAARALDKHYIPACYPNGFDTGAPKDYYTVEDAKEAVIHAERILGHCQSTFLES